MGVCAILLGKGGRKCLGTTLLLLNLTIAISGLLLICTGTVLAFLIRQQRNLLKDYNYKKIVRFINGMGITLILFHLLCGKVCYDSGSHKRCERVKGFLFPIMGLLLVDACCVLALSIECRKSIHGLSKGFQSGFEALMENYGTDFNRRQEVDHLHIKNKCCGSTGYEGWLDVAWYSDEYIRPEAKKAKGNKRKRGVPFSCCDPEKMGPCTHDIVEIQKPGFKFVKGKTFYTRGCGEAIMVNIKWVLGMLSAWSMLPFGLQLIVIFMVKYLHSSINNALERGDIKGPGWGYLIHECPCSCFEFIECDTEVKGKRRHSDSEN